MSVRKQIQIVDDYGTPLPGANVYTPDKNFGSISDFDGNVVAEAQSPSAPVIISYVGFATQQQSWANLPSKIVLRPSAEMLDEVVIVANKPKEKTPWHVYASLGLGIIGLLVAFSGGETPKKVKL